MISRRSFLTRTALAAGAVASLSPTSYLHAAKANKSVRVAVIGIRGKGAHHIEMLQAIPDVRIVALCDADQDVLNAQLANLAKRGLTAEGFTDMRRIFDRKDVDAVFTATPNHWHSLVTVWACQAGKDVYVEKPVSHNIWEGRKAVQAARRYKRIVQSGTQSRSDPALREAFEYLRQGNLGPIRLARGFCYKRRDTIGKVPGPQPLPPKLNYDLWSGPAQLEPLRRKNLHYDWHWVWSTGNGDIGNQGVHEMDMCRWAIGQNTLPEHVMCIGGRFGYDDDGETANTQIVLYEYKPVPIIFEVRGLPRGKDEGGEAMDIYKGARIGIVIECENGYFTGGGGGGWACDKDGKRLKQFAGPGGAAHVQNFIDAVRSRKVSDLAADIEQGHRSSALCHLGNISYRLGQKVAPEEIGDRVQSDADLTDACLRAQAHLEANGVDLTKSLPTLGPRLTFDPRVESFSGEWSDYANLYVSRPYREPYVIREKV
jgi:predicted dehydrogenase